MNHKEIQIKSLGININDKKKLITLFEGKYQQFLNRNKGTDFSSKDSIIILLNSKPRSFLRTLKTLVKNFKNFDNRLTANISTLHPKKLASLRKPTLTGAATIPVSRINKNTSTAQLASAQHKLELNASVKLINASAKLRIPLSPEEIIIKKTQEVTKSLNKNKIAMPLNLLRPILNINSTIYGALYGSATNISASLLPKQDGRKYNKKGELIKPIYAEGPKINISELLGLQESFNKNAPRSGSVHSAAAEFNKLYRSQINKLKKNINNYNTKNVLPITTQKYLKLITPFKSVNSFQQNINFNFNLANNRRIQQIYDLLEYAFRAMSCLISKPVYMETPDKMIINLFYFLVPGKAKPKKKIISKKKIVTSINGIPVPKASKSNFSEYADYVNKNFDSIDVKGIRASFNGKNSKNFNTKPKFNKKNVKLSTSFNKFKLKLLCTILSRIFRKNVEFDLTRLHFPFFDDNILVKAIAIMTKKVPVRNIIRFIFSKTIIHSNRTNNLTNRGSIIPSFLGGIKIKIGGRLMTQRVIPRLSSRVIQRGAIARGKTNYVDWSRVNLKNKRGAHSITVTMSHVL